MTLARHSHVSPIIRSLVSFASIFGWKCSNGKYLYWFHNHGGRSYEDRNPAWLCGGVETDSPAGKTIAWSEPEIALYDDDPRTRMSYPDLIEDSGRFFLTETQKETARVHPIDRSLLEGLWSQADNRRAATQGLVLDLPGARGEIPQNTPMPPLPVLTTTGAGFAIDLWVTFDAISPGQVLLDSRTGSGQGMYFQTTSHSAVEVILNNGRSESRWDCDPDLLHAGRSHHIVVNIDGGPKIITFLVDGRLCDGGETRQFGWGRFHPNLRDVNGAQMLRIGPGLSGRIHHLRIYDRYLRTSEAVGNYCVGLPGAGS
jgi:hypothetical protein